MAEEKIEKGVISEEALGEIAGGLDPSIIKKLAKTYAMPVATVSSICLAIVSHINKKQTYNKGVEDGINFAFTIDTENNKYKYEHVDDAMKDFNFNKNDNNEDGD